MPRKSIQKEVVKEDIPKAIPKELEPPYKPIKPTAKPSEKVKEYLYRSHDILDLERLKKEGLISKTPQEAAKLARTKLTPEELKGWPPIKEEVWGIDEQRTKAPRLF